MSHSYVSIGIPIYNAEEYLNYAISSILAQTHEYWELILIDDGSTDRSLEIARSFEKGDERIRVISDGLNKKLPIRLNQIIDEAQYDYIVRMDADDLAHPDRLKVQLEFLEKNSNYDLVATGIVSIDNNNKIHGYRNVRSNTTNVNVETGFPIVHPSLFARKTWYERNNYSEDYPRSEDYELWCRASNKGDFRIAILPDLLLYYRELGVISSSKLINSYQDGLQVRLKYKKYSKKNKYIEKKRILLKYFITIFIFKVGAESYIIKKRNKLFSDSDAILYHQKIVDRIVSAI